MDQSMRSAKKMIKSVKLDSREPMSVGKRKMTKNARLS
jgi:hypothetical protein